MRFCADLGMFAIDRPVSSCVHATSQCKRECYNRKLYAMYKDMRVCDIRLADEWSALDGADIFAQLRRKRTRQTDRVRLMTRGESFATVDDIAKVAGLCAASPKTLFWAPTRAWRSRPMMLRLERLAARCPNIRLMASTDRTTSKREWRMLAQRGWSTMFFGEDSLVETPTGEPMHRCAKTWEHKHGACATCDEGCFRTDRVNVHLKSH